MYTTLIWLLVFLGDVPGGYGAVAAPVVIERFAEAAECDRVRKLIEADRGASPKMRCVQARVVAQHSK